MKIKISIVSAALAILVSALFLVSVPVNANPEPANAYAQTLCGNGSESENYGFSYDLQQPHWTVNYLNFVSEDTVNQVDVILDKLENDNVAQTMILFKSQDEVGNRVNCAVHFLRYMKLGSSYGERKDNGFAFLIVVENNKIDVHYGVGLGLPALTAPELTSLNRLAEETYLSTNSMDAALLALISGFDTYARSKYSPLVYSPATEPTLIYITMPSTPMSSLGTGTICCLACVGIILLILFVIIITRFGRFFSWIPTLPGSGWGGDSSPWSGPSSGGGPVMRGGGGSGRSNRGN